MGTVLVLGGIAHTLGVSRFYFNKGVPDLNRVLLDAWVAEAQILGGVFFLVSRKKTNPRPWILGGAALIWTYAVPFLPVLVRRAPPIFWIMPAVYAGTSLALIRWSRLERDREPGTKEPLG